MTILKKTGITKKNPEIKGDARGVVVVEGVREKADTSERACRRKGEKKELPPRYQKKKKKEREIFLE